MMDTIKYCYDNAEYVSVGNYAVTVGFN